MPRLTVLYFDDEAICLEVFQGYFGDAYDVRTARTLEEARRALDECDFDVVISDRHMPEIDGAEFLREVARRRPRSFRVMLTGEASVGDMLAELGSGVVQLFMTKPWTHELMPLIAERAGLL